MYARKTRLIRAGFRGRAAGVDGPTPETVGAPGPPLTSTSELAGPPSGPTPSGVAAPDPASWTRRATIAVAARKATRSTSAPIVCIPPGRAGAAGGPGG